MGVEDKQWLKLSDGEDVLWWGHPSLVMYIPELAGGILLVIVGIVGPFLDLPYEQLHPDLRIGLTLLIPLGLLIIVIDLIRRKYTYYVVTTDKIWRKSGFFSRDRDPIHFNRVVNTKTTESVGERLVSILVPGTNVGDMRILTADDQTGDMFLDDVPDIETVSQLIEDGMSAYSGGGASGMQYGGQNTRSQQNNADEMPERPNMQGSNEGQNRQRRRGNDGSSNYPDSSGRHDKSQNEPWDN